MPRVLGDARDNRRRPSCYSSKAAIGCVFRKSGCQRGGVLAPSIFCFNMNGEPLPAIHGAPLRLRVENQLGYKMIKWIERIEFVESEKQLGKGEGGSDEDDEYFDLLPNI